MPTDTLKLSLLRKSGQSNSWFIRRCKNRMSNIYLLFSSVGRERREVISFSGVTVIVAKLVVDDKNYYLIGTLTHNDHTEANIL